MKDLTKLLEEFKTLDSKLNDLESKDGVILIDYGAAQYTKEYEKTLHRSQRIYHALIKNNIDPFAS